MEQQTDATGDLGTRLKRARKAAGFSNAYKLLGAIKADDGKAPSYSTYAQWESGEVTPRDENIAPVIAFHRRRGTWIEVETHLADLPTALLALAAELRASREEREVMRQERETMRQELAALEALVGQLARERLSGPALEAPAAPGARRPKAGSTGR